MRVEFFYNKLERLYEQNNLNVAYTVGTHYPEV